MYQLSRPVNHQRRTFLTAPSKQATALCQTNTKNTTHNR